LHVFNNTGITNFSPSHFSSHSSKIKPVATSFFTQLESTEFGDRKTTSLSELSMPSDIFSINESPGVIDQLSSQISNHIQDNQDPIGSTISLSALL